MRTPNRECFPKRALRTKPATFLLGLGIGGLLAGGPALADEPPVLKPALQRQLESQVLREVCFNNVDLTEALVYLQIQVQTSSENAVRVPFIVQLPADFKPRYELTLNLKSVPCWEVLRHLGAQAGIEFSIVKDSVRIRPAGDAAAAQAMVRTVIPAPAAQAPIPAKMTGRLGTPARPFAMGDKSHYTTSGVIQPQRSGSIPHRSMSGWSIESDPGNRMSVNCVDIAKCKAHTGGGPCPCGCTVCGCQPSKVPEKPSPQP